MTSTRKNTARAIVVAKQTAYERLVENPVEEQSAARARQLLERKDPTVARWLKAHQDHRRTLSAVERQLREVGARVCRVKGSLTDFDPTDARLIVTVGGDGTLLATSHQVDATPILGINSSPDNSVGFFCAGSADAELGKLIELAWSGKLPRVELARMQISINGQVCSKRVLNEALFCHVVPAATSRYILSITELGEPAGDESLRVTREEEQRSSGIWVGTAAGSTAAIHSAGGKVLPFSSRHLQLVVREPYVALGPPYALTRLVLEDQQGVRVRNKMERASVFVDGPFDQYAVGLGDIVDFTISDQPLTVLGLRSRRT